MDMTEYDLDILDDAGFDTEKGLMYSADDEDIYFECLQTYADSCEAKLGDLSGYYEAADWKKYGVLVHAIKSNSKMIGLSGMYEKALALENAAGREDEAFIRAEHNGLVEEYRRMAGIIRDAAL